MTVEPVEEGDRFSIGEMENVSKKGVKRAEETAISAKENDVDKSRQRCNGRAAIGRTGSCKRPPPGCNPPPPASGVVRGSVVFVVERCAWCVCDGRVEECGRAVREGEVGAEAAAEGEDLAWVHEWGGDAGRGI